ncbi:MAG: YafY family protein [Ethanoligenens sp.]
MKIDRLIAIIMLLLEREKVSAKELADTFEVSTRTIYRDLDTINQAGIPIRATCGPSGGAEILKTYKVERRLFSTLDIVTLLMGVESIQSNLPNDKIIATLAKVKSMIAPEQQKEVYLRANQIKIDLAPWLHGGNLSNTIETIKLAMERQWLLCFDYRDIQHHRSRREIEPYRLLLKGDTWYVQGYCLMRDGFRTFKLLRMRNISILEQTFEFRENSFGILDEGKFQDKKLVPAKLRIHEEIEDEIVARFGVSCLTPFEHEYAIADVQIPVNDLACRYLLGFGDKCVCLEPKELRDKMRSLTVEIGKLYKSE